MIAIYAPYPFADRVRGGWTRRIAAVERIFADRSRTYFFPGDPTWAADPMDYRVHVEEVGGGARFAWLDLRFSNHHRWLTDLVERADFVYAHTGHSMQHMLPYYATGKVITDLHGLAPEEELLQGNAGRAAFFGQFEETMIRQSAALVTVTDAMARHFEMKYPGTTTPTILLPIVDEIPAAPASRRTAGPRPVVVYAGGAQSWQNVGAMMDAVARCRADFDFAFYSDQVDALRDAARRAGVAERIRFGCAAPAELPAIYAAADFGFVLRDASPVNRVSCPTKLSEYLAYGVVPVVDLVEIGDFARLGYCYVALSDFLAGRVPAPLELEAMRQRNRAVFAAIQAAFAAGVDRLRRLPSPTPRVSIARHGGLFLTSVERAAVYPLRGARIVIEASGGTREVSLDDHVSAVIDRTVDLRGLEVRGIEVHLPHGPFLTTPVRLEAVDELGREDPLTVTGDHWWDLYGNWVLDGRRPVLRAACRGGARLVRARLRFEIVLAGPEAYVARRGP
jgi:hypothetical protein